MRKLLWITMCALSAACANTSAPDEPTPSQAPKPRALSAILTQDGPWRYSESTREGALDVAIISFGEDAKGAMEATMGLSEQTDMAGIPVEVALVVALDSAFTWRASGRQSVSLTGTSERGALRSITYNGMEVGAFMESEELSMLPPDVREELAQNLTAMNETFAEKLAASPPELFAGTKTWEVEAIEEGTLRFRNAQGATLTLQRAQGA